ncbi:membrane traffic protein [Lithospermum erythrorhizon]|uniref:Membrane traffic protein n=1 Tax=Lithospermum erythrorhizon TaxID=34254 RepID=A0AAV3NG92_LITER
MCLADLEADFINPYDSTSRVNNVILPEFVTQGILCALHLVSGHWIMFLLCLPYLYYNVKLYTERRHLMDVTEIFNQISWEKKVRICKLGYMVIIIALSIVWLMNTLWIT